MCVWCRAIEGRLGEALEQLADKQSLIDDLQNVRHNTNAHCNVCIRLTAIVELARHRQGLYWSSIRKGFTGE